MKKPSYVVLVAVFALASWPSFAQVTSTSTGGAGGSGGSAAGGTATGGTSTNTNTTTGGTSSAAGGSSNIGSATSNSQAADVSVNYITPAGAAGVNGLAPGVDPANNHVVSDNNVHYSGTTKIKNTPDISIGGPASGPCNGASGGVGVGIPGLAVGANVSTVDKGCEARETARVAAMLGRMDVANAILENMDVVVAALRARGDRDAQAALELERRGAQARAAAVANAAVAQAVQAGPEGPQAARDREAQAMRVQQQAGVEALARQATMAKVNDTLSFTGKLTQGEEKTPQQLMVEDLAARQVANAVARDADRPVEPPAAPQTPPDQPALPQAQGRQQPSAQQQVAPRQVVQPQDASQQVAEQQAAQQAAQEQSTQRVEQPQAVQRQEAQRATPPRQAAGQQAAEAHPQAAPSEALRSPGTEQQAARRQAPRRPGDPDAATRQIADQAVVDRKLIAPKTTTERPAAASGNEPPARPPMTAGRPTDPVAKPASSPHREADRKRGSRTDDEAVRFALGLGS